MKIQKRWSLPVLMVGFFGLILYCTDTQAGYIDNGDGTVTDANTGLMWQQATAQGDRYRWDQALYYPTGLFLGNYSDWRLPTIEELATLIDSSRYDPAINTKYFPDTVASDYWSCSGCLNVAGCVMRVNFNDGAVYGAPVDFYYSYIRAVRLAQFWSFDTNGNGVPDILEYYYGFRGNAGYSADPVNTGIGNYVYDHVDLALPGPGMEFDFKRTYNSLNPEIGPVGYGWNHSYATITATV